MSQRVEAVASMSAISNDFLESLHLSTLEEMCFVSALKDLGYQDQQVVLIVDQYKNLLPEARKRDKKEWYHEYCIMFGLPEAES